MHHLSQPGRAWQARPPIDPFARKSPTLCSPSNRGRRQPVSDATLVARVHQHAVVVALAIQADGVVGALHALLLRIGFKISEVLLHMSQLE